MRLAGLGSTMNANDLDWADYRPKKELNDIWSSLDRWRTVAARAHSVPMESESALDSLIGAYPHRRTGIHFAGICVSVLLAASCGFSAPARAQVALGRIDDNAAIFIDGRTFQVTRGAAKDDTTAAIKILRARPLGPAAIVFRVGDKLYVARPPLPLQGRDAYVTADEGPPSRIHIEYKEPKNPDLQKIYQMVMARGSLQKVKELLSPVRLPEDLYVKELECGVSNTYYLREKGRPTISLCYEYLKEVQDNLPPATTMDGITAEEAMVGQLMFAALHESGHAMFDIFRVPIFGSQEDAADQFATYIMLQFGGEKAHRLIRGAAYSELGVIRRIKDQSKPNVTVPLAAFSSEHGAPEQRFYNLACFAYGYDPKVFAPVIDKDLLPQSRAEDCKWEYSQLSYAFRTLISPYVDMAVVEKVHHEDWLPPDPAQPKD